MAKESPFSGERENALAAAERLASRHGLTLEEAATGISPSQTGTTNADAAKFAKDLAAFVHMTDYQIFLEKQRRDAARREAEERGLDNNKSKKAGSPPPRQTRRSNARMEPHRHAWALVRETKLSYQEIAKITGLDIYQILHMKIQLLRAA